MTAKRLSIPALVSWGLAAIALWVTMGALTAITDRRITPRVAFTPSPGWLLLLLAGAALLASIPIFRRREHWLLSLSTIVFLPWLPFYVPRALLVWTGPIRTWLWALIVVAVAASIGRTFLARRSAVGAWTTDPRRAPWIAFVVAATVYIAGAWLVFPRLPAGDEPHYLVMTQSLLRDHDLKIENNHQRGDYLEYFGGRLRPDFLRRGTDGEIYSIHPVGLPVVVAPVYAVAGYAGVLALLALISAAATSITWVVVWRLTHNTAATWFAWAAVSLSAPFFYQAFTVYPDAPGGLVVMIGMLALLADEVPTTRRVLFTGAALAVLPWLHTRFAVLELVIAVLLLLRILWSGRAMRGALALLAVPVPGALAWFGYFHWIYGTPNPAAPYNGYTQSEIGNLVRGVPGLLFDQQFGLLPNAPVYLCAIVGLWALLRHRPRIAFSILAVIGPYGAAVAAYAMWWAGYSSPARFLVPILLVLAVPIGFWFATLHSRSARLLACASLMVSVLITATIAGVDRGALLFNVRDGSSRLLLWLSPLVDVTSGLPSLFRTEWPTSLLNAATWLTAIALVGAAGRLFEKRRPSSAALASAVGFTAVAATSLALSIVWRTNAAQPVRVDAGATALLRRYDPDAGQVSIRYPPFERVANGELPPLITLARVKPTDRRADEGLLLLTGLPAATYEIEAFVSRATAGQLSVTLDRQFDAAWKWNLAGIRTLWRETITVPVPVPALLIDADQATRDAIQYVSVRAVDIPGGRHQLSRIEPMHVVRYGPALVFLMSGDAYTEPGGTWIAGGGAAEFVIAPDPGAPIRLFVRNAPVTNEVTLESGSWRQVLSLQPREERLLDVPTDPNRPGVPLRASCASGARPADYEKSDDTRLLGCWIETR